MVPISPQPTESRWPYWFLDSRSLSLFRVLLGLTTLWSIFDYLPNLTWFIGSQAVVTAEAAWQGYTVKPWLFSLLFVFPENELAAWLVVIVASLGAIMLAAGWFARSGALLCWLAFGTIMARNPLVLHSGDSFMILMLLYATLLPVDRHFLIGAPAKSPLIFCNFATSLWFIQIAILYLSAGLAKAPVATWRNGEHLGLILGGTEVPTAFGAWLGQFDRFNQLGTVGSLILELSLPVLVLALPSRWQRVRLALLLILLLFHATIGLTLQVGLFAMLSITAASTLIPPLFWERLSANPSRAPTHAHPSGHRSLQMTFAALVGLLFTWQALSALYPKTTPFPLPFNAALHQLQINQRWTVFAQTPKDRTRWAVELISENGARTDLRLGFHLLPHRFYELPSETSRFGGSRWRFLIFDQFLSRPATRVLVPRFLEMEARRMVDQPEILKNKTIELVVYLQPIEQAGSTQFYRQVLGSTQL